MVMESIEKILIISTAVILLYFSFSPDWAVGHSNKVLTTMTWNEGMVKTSIPNIQPIAGNPYVKPFKGVINENIGN